MALEKGFGQVESVQSAHPLEAGGDAVVVHDAQLLFTADYSRLGDDLLLTGADGARQIITGYFASDSPPVLASPGGAVMTPDVVAHLVGPRAPGQYAQVGVADEQRVPIGEVDSVNGSAEVVRDGVPITLHEGDPVFQDDVLQTGLASGLVIGFADDTIFSLGANARMVLDGMVYDPAGSSNSLTLSVVHGVFSFVTGQIAPTGGMDVHTPVITLGIRGTTVHGILETIAGPLTVFLGRDQLSTTAQIVLEDPLTGVPVGSLTDLGLAFTLSGVGARPVLRALTAQEQSFGLERAEVVHGVQSTFQFHYSTGEPIVQPGETLRTQAGPNLPSGGIGYDREGGAGEALGNGLLAGLEGSPPLTLLNGFPLSRLALFNATNFFTSATATTRVELGEPNAGAGEGTFGSGQIVLTGGLEPDQSLALNGLTFTAGGKPISLSSGGVPVSVTQGANQAQGTAGGVPVFTFRLNPNGSFTFSLFRPLDHPIAGKTGAADTIDIGFNIVVTFTDGSTLQASVVSVVLDSGPVATAEAGAVSEAGDLGELVADTLPLEGGRDGVKSVALIGQSTAVTAGGQPVGLVKVSEDTYLGRTPDGTEIFRMVFDAVTGNYAFTLLHAIDQPGPGADSLDLVFRVAVTDGDNDSVVSTITISALDDIPAAGANEPVSVQESALEDGSGGGTTVAEGTLAFVAGADGASISAISLGALTGVADGNELVIAGAFFELRVDTQSGDYVYALTDNTLAHAAGEPLVQDFTYTVRDGDGDTAAGHLMVRVDDDGPVAHDDTDSLSAGATAAGNVLSGGEGADTPGADGALVTGVAIGETDGAVAGGVGAAIETALGTLVLNADGSYNYTAKANVSGVDTFTYTITDGDADTSTATLSLTIDESAPTVTPTVAQVDEAGLDAGDVAPGDDLGSDPDNNSETTDPLHLVFADPDAPVRVVSVAFDGTVVAVPADNTDVTIDSASGTLTVRADGTYSYTLTNNVDHNDGPVSETFAYTVSDGLGNTAGETITVDILDDAPFVSANAPATVQESALEHGGGGGAAVAAGTLAFTPGADGASITGISLGALIGVPDGDDLVIAGPFFEFRVDTLTGDYTYTLTDRTAHAGAGLVGAADQVVQTFDYTVTDGDGDAAAGTLTVRIDDDGPSVTDIAAIHDETPGVDPLSDDTGDAPPLPAEIADLGLEIVNVSKKPIAFTYGADGPGGIALDPVADQQAGDPSGLVDAATGQQILLFDGPDGAIVGRIGCSNGEIAFVSILGGPAAPSGPGNESSADLWFVQYRAIQHDNPLDPDEANPEPAGVQVTETLTFDNVAAGTYDGTDGALDGQFAVFGDGGGGPVLVSGLNPLLPGTNAAVVFDTANPGGLAAGFGTPHQDFGGPATGGGGAAGSAFVNNQPLGNVLIMGRQGTLVDGNGDGLIDTPLPQGFQEITMTFDFSEIDSQNGVTLDSITMLDVDGSNPDAIRLFGASDVLLGTFGVVDAGFNGVQSVDLGGTAGVLRMEIDIVGSAGFDNLVYSRTVEPHDEIVSLGYTVTDADGDTAAGLAAITIEDDGPAAHDASIYLTAGDPALAGDVTANDVFGTDGRPAPDQGVVSTAYTADDGFGAPTTLTVPAGVAVPQTFAGGSLTVDPDGSFLYTAPDSLSAGKLVALGLDADSAGYVDDFSYVIRDADGDLSGATQHVRVVLDDSRAQFGDGGANLLDGGASSDVLSGGGGNDVLSGGGGGDLLFGDAGDDTLIGGQGNDLMFGDDGADTFSFSLAANEGNDTVADFSASQGDVLSFTDVTDVQPDGNLDINDVVSSFGKTGSTVSVELHSGTSITITDLDGVINTADDLLNHSAIA